MIVFVYVCLAGDVGGPGLGDPRQGGGAGRARAAGGAAVQLQHSQMTTPACRPADLHHLGVLAVAGLAVRQPGRAQELVALRLGSPHRHYVRLQYSQPYISMQKLWTRREFLPG